MKKALATLVLGTSLIFSGYSCEDSSKVNSKDIKNINKTLKAGNKIAVLSTNPIVSKNMFEEVRDCGGTNIFLESQKDGKRLLYKSPLLIYDIITEDFNSDGVDDFMVTGYKLRDMIMSAPLKEESKTESYLSVGNGSFSYKKEDSRHNRRF